MAKQDRDILEVFEEIVDLLEENRRNLVNVKGLLVKYRVEKAKALSAAIERRLADQEKGERASAIKRKRSKGRSRSAEKNTLYCSFCGKSQHEVKKLIAGPTVFICDECTTLCMAIIEGEASPVDTGKGEGGDPDGA